MTARLAPILALLLTAAARRMQQDKNARKTVVTVAGAGLSAIDMMT